MPGSKMEGLVSSDEFNEQIALEKFEHLATQLKSHLYDRHADFNSQFDETYITEYGEINIAGNKVKPSQILFYFYNDEYKQQMKMSLEERFNEILSLETNEDRINDLIQLVKNKRVVPFVGAGLTVSCGMPTWTSFLNDQATENELDLEMFKSLISKGHYENCADLLLEQMTGPRFNERYKHSFTLRQSVVGPIKYLPTIFTNGVITTNFDEVLEKTYALKSRPLDAITEDWMTHVKKGNNFIYKIHGTIEGTANRVLTKNEYDSKYGENGSVNLERVLPKFLRACTESFSLMFVGCSLTSDRTFQTLKKINSEFGMTTTHFAILQKPEDRAKRNQREKELVEANIFPIWYEVERYEQVELILNYLKLKFEGIL